MKTGAPLVEVVRSGFVESLHSGHLIVLDPAGDAVLELGDPQQPIFPRSSNKPLQAVGMCRLGLDVARDELALATGSHSGEPVHVEVAQRMLQRAGLTEDDLGCPPDWPIGEAASEVWIAGGGARTRLRMNCSGKHAAMLLTCRANGWPLESYLSPDHTLQVALRDTVADLAGQPVAATGVDGCGAAVFAISVRALARAFARLATAAGGPERAVADAMRSEPHLVGGTGRSVTRLMAGIRGLIAKDGAEGVYAAALPDGTAVAVKVDDGAQRAAERAVVAALRQFGGHADVLDELAEAPLTGGGRPVGSIRVIGALPFAP